MTKIGVLGFIAEGPDIEGCLAAIGAVLGELGIDLADFVAERMVALEDVLDRGIGGCRSGS